MAAHDWRQWTPARVGDSAAWRLIRFDAVDDAGKPVGRCTEALAPSGGRRTFPSEHRAQLAADWLNTHPEEAADA